MFYDLAGREFSKKPIVEGTLVRVYKGYFDTFNENEVCTDKFGIIVNVERFMEDDRRGTYNLMPLYDIVYLDLDGNIIGRERRVPYNNVSRAGLRLKSPKYNKLNETIERLNSKIIKSF